MVLDEMDMRHIRPQVAQQLAQPVPRLQGVAGSAKPAARVAQRARRTHRAKVQVADEIFRLRARPVARVLHGEMDDFVPLRFE